ncbi:hypothetical protein BsWGS_14044 [Bradybaena similaris]
MCTSWLTYHTDLIGKWQQKVRIKETSKLGKIRLLDILLYKSQMIVHFSNQILLHYNNRILLKKQVEPA